ncbi:MAG: hypothetical protein ABH827_03640 [bacterium]
MKRIRVFMSVCLFILFGSYVQALIYTVSFGNGVKKRLFCNGPLGRVFAKGFSRKQCVLIEEFFSAYDAYEASKRKLSNQISIEHSLVCYKENALAFASVAILGNNFQQLVYELLRSDIISIKKEMETKGIFQEILLYQQTVQLNEELSRYELGFQEYCGKYHEIRV